MEKSKLIHITATIYILCLSIGVSLIVFKATRPFYQTTGQLIDKFVYSGKCIDCFTNIKCDSCHYMTILIDYNNTLCTMTDLYNSNIFDNYKYNTNYDIIINYDGTCQNYNDYYKNKIVVYKITGFLTWALLIISVITVIISAIVYHRLNSCNQIVS